jgi:signal recognition particle subunit SRP14
MTTLKKRDKKKEKARFEKAQLRRKKLATDVEIIGPKRGAGRKRRERRVAAAIKQTEARENQAERDELRVKKQTQSSLL